MFVKINHYPSCLEKAKSDHYEVVLNTDHIMNIIAIKDAIPDYQEYLHEDITEDGYRVVTDNKNYYLVYEEGRALIKRLLSIK